MVCDRTRVANGATLTERSSGTGNIDDMVERKFLLTLRLRGVRFKVQWAKKRGSPKRNSPAKAELLELP